MSRIAACTPRRTPRLPNLRLVGDPAAVTVGEDGDNMSGIGGYSALPELEVECE